MADTCISCFHSFIYFKDLPEDKQLDLCLGLGFFFNFLKVLGLLLSQTNMMLQN